MISTEEGWIKSAWRPAMGWVYVTVCVFDFVIAPVLWSAGQGYIAQNILTREHAVISQQWKPLTLEGSGLFHVAMGSVLGVTSFGRTKEKLNGVAGDRKLK